MPNPQKPLIELTPRVQAIAAIILLTVSVILGSMVATADAPRQQTEFGRNFAPIVVVPAVPPAPAPAIEDAPPPVAPPAPPARETSRASEI